MALFTITVNKSVNLPPNQIGNNTNSVINYENLEYTFLLSNFTTDTIPVYSDPEGDDVYKLKITSLPGIGKLLYNDIDVEVNDEIIASNISLLVYEIDQSVTTGYSFNFTFNLSDTGSENYFTGSNASYKADVTAIMNQAPSSVGNKTFTISDNEIVVFTVENFTTETTPTYADPEGDPANKLKITSLPSTGIINLNSIPVNINQIILFNEIKDGELTYTPDDSAPYNMTFNFKIADLGSGIFVG